MRIDNVSEIHKAVRAVGYHKIVFMYLLVN